MAGAGGGYDISASLSSSSASRQTVAADNQFEIGRLVFGEKKDNTLLYIISGVVVLVAVLKLTGKKKR